MSGQPPLPATLIELPLLPLRDVVVFPHMVIPCLWDAPRASKRLSRPWPQSVASCWWPKKQRPKMSPL